MATIIFISLTVLYIISVVGAIRRIGKPRQPLGTDDAIYSLIFGLLCVGAIYYLYVN